MRVAQVTARLAATIVDVAHVAPGERYAIGTARDVQLAVGGVREFPLVSSEDRGFVVRRPVGLGAFAIDGKPSDETELVLSWARVTLQLGLVSIAIELVERSAVSVPRPQVDRRTPVFVVGSLIVHLLVWGAAIAFGHLPRAKKPRPVKQSHPLVVHLAPLPPAPPPQQQPPPSQLPATSVASARSTASPPAASRSVHAAAHRASSEPVADGGDHLPVDENGNASMGAAFARLAEAIPDVGAALDKVGPLYVPSAVDHPFGDVAKMDPKTRPGWGSLTIVTGRYRTIGVDDPLPASQGLALCESRRCEVAGGLAKEDIQQTAATRGYDLQQCMVRGAALLELDIAPDGSVKKVRGQGAAARCAATVIASLAFPAADAATHVTFTIGYP
jgi:hypothetical protein